jgi:ubiquitin C-terminal hydrolase
VLSLPVDKYGSQYKGGSQHDAQEFLLWLLDKVHEELNMATKKKYKPSRSAGNSNTRPDDVLAAEALANYARCNNSFVVDIFQAALWIGIFVLKSDSVIKYSKSFFPQDSNPILVKSEHVPGLFPCVKELKYRYSCRICN